MRELEFDELVRIYDEALEEAKSKLPPLASVDLPDYRIVIPIWGKRDDWFLLTERNEVPVRFEDNNLIFVFHKVFVRGIAIAWKLKQ